MIGEVIHLRGRRRTGFAAVAEVVFAAFLAMLSACTTVKVQAEGDTILFSGYRWDVVDEDEPIGPGPNRFSGRNVSVDASGRLVLRIGEGQGGWTCAEVFLDRSLSYGTYELSLPPIAKGLDPSVVFGFYTWDEAPDFAHREIDVELARWGRPEFPDLNFSVQPSEEHPERNATFEFDLSRPLTLRFEWRPDRVVFSATSGSDTRSWTFAPGNGSPSDSKGPSMAAKRADFGVPPDGDELLSLNLWLFGGPAQGAAAEVVIDRFSYKPPSP